MVQASRASFDKFVADGNTSNAALGYASLEDIAKECSWMNGWTR